MAQRQALNFCWLVAGDVGECGVDRADAASGIADDDAFFGETEDAPGDALQRAYARIRAEVASELSASLGQGKRRQRKDRAVDSCLQNGTPGARFASRRDWMKAHDTTNVAPQS